jgi:hypothetical protein
MVRGEINELASVLIWGAIGVDLIVLALPHCHRHAGPTPTTALMALPSETAHTAPCLLPR